MSLSFQHLLIFGAVALLLFGGKNKISDVMGDLAKGLRSFKKGLTEDDEAKPAAHPVDPARSIDHYAPPPPPPSASTQPHPYPSQQPASRGEADRVG